MKERLKRIHINQHKIKSNKKHGTNEPVITVKSSVPSSVPSEASLIKCCK